MAISMWKMRKVFLLGAIRRLYYAAIHGIYCGIQGTMLPATGRGEFVDVLRRGDFTDIYDHASGEMVRILPFQPNHGVMVEWIVDGKVRTRRHLSFGMLREFSSPFDCCARRNDRCSFCGLSTRRYG